MAQSVKHLTVDFSLGHDFIVPEIEPCIRLDTDGGEPTWDSLFLLSAPPPHSLPVSQNK